MPRRDRLWRMSLIGAGGPLASGFAQAALKGVDLHTAPLPSVLTAEQREMISQLAELILPKTDTPGAIEAGVPGFIDQIVSRWYTPAERRIFVAGLARLEAFCSRTWGKPLTAGDPPQQKTALPPEGQAAAVYMQGQHSNTTGAPSHRIREAPDEQSPFFYKLKLLTVLGYYTSEVGSQQELSYNPVPGRYEGDFDFSKVGRQWSY